MRYLFNHWDTAWTLYHPPSAVTHTGAARLDDRRATSRGLHLADDRIAALHHSDREHHLHNPVAGVVRCPALVIPTRILDEANVIIALTLYTTALLVRAVPKPWTPCPRRCGTPRPRSDTRTSPGRCELNYRCRSPF